LEAAYSDADVLDLFCSEWITRVGTKALHPCVGGSVDEDNKGFSEFGGHMVTGWRPIPSPAEVRE
jgi:hypothetical protein